MNYVGGISAGGASRSIVSKYTLPVFQAKPGYSTLWRQYRKEYSLLTSQPYFRQRRLTNYFLSFKKMKGLSVLYNLELSLFAVLRASKFFFSDSASMTCLLGGRIWLNGAMVRYPHMQLYVGDCLQLSVNPNDFFANRADFNWIELQRAKFVSKSLRYFSTVTRQSNLSVQPRASWLLTR